jgi:hypothetical protein
LSSNPPLLIYPPLVAPILIEGRHPSLHLESRLNDLPLYQFQINWNCLGSALANVLECYPLLPGVVLVDQDAYTGFLSRRRLLEFLIRPLGPELFLNQPLRVLHSYARSDVLVLSGETPILVAAQQALRRSPELLGEPLLVQTQSDIWAMLDVQTLNLAAWQIRGIETQVRYERTQAQMIQSDKMSSLGRLVDGVAHEILDPVSFIWGNLSYVASYSEALLQLLTAYEAHLPNPPPALISLREQLEVDYLRQDLPCTVTSLRKGAERLSKLASSLQNFCHIDEVHPKPADLHDMLDSILLLLKSRLSSEIEVIKQYGRLPPVPCFAGQLNQVLMNILTDVVDRQLNQAVSQHMEPEWLSARTGQDAGLSGHKPKIAIVTQVRSLLTDDQDESRWVSICIMDNGPGLPPEILQQIRQSCSIEQRAAKETSLTVSYQIVTAKHGGKFELRSRCQSSTTDKTVMDLANRDSLEVVPSPETIILDEFQTGTEFEILLPLF